MTVALHRSLRPQRTGRDRGACTESTSVGLGSFLEMRSRALGTRTEAWPCWPRPPAKAFASPGAVGWALLASPGDWADRRFDDLLKVLKVAALAGTALALVVLALGLLLWIPPLLRLVRHGAWKASRPAPGGLWRRSWGRLRRWWYWPWDRMTGLALRLGDLNDASPGGNRLVPAAELTAALAKLSKTDREGVGRIGAPAQASGAFADLTKALDEVPEGKLAGAIVSFALQVLPRDQLLLSGYLVAPERGDPELVLTLNQANGNITDSVVLDATEYESRPATAYRGQIPARQRVRRLAIAGASWTLYKALCQRRALSDKDLEKVLGTAEWESYAWVQVALAETAADRREAAYALYQRALNVDANNPVAHYNLARLQGRDGDYEAARKRLEVLCQRLHGKGQPLPRDQNPLRYQVDYSLALGDLNQALEKHGVRRPLPTHERDTLKRALKEHLTPALTDLERALLKPKEINNAAVEEHLRDIEGPLIALWAHLQHLTYCCNWLEPRPTCPIKRQRLVTMLSDLPALVPPDSVIKCFLPDHVRMTARTKYNLACYYAETGDDDHALELLGAALATGGRNVWAKRDPTLKPLQERQPERWRTLLARN
jgi:tetratricopeptide (TPR) repeat protein